MAVPSSGELKLWDMLWNQELAGSKGDNSLHSASVYAGFSTPDALSDFYGFSDVETPSVETLSAESVTATTATLRGCVTDTGNEDVTSGFYFGTSNTATSNPKLTLPGTRGTGIYCCAKTSIPHSTTQKVFAFACNSAGECIAPNCCSFTTPAPPFSPLTCTFYQCSRSRVSDIGTNIASHTTQAFVRNPYTSAMISLWTTPTVTGTGNACIGLNCFAARNGDGNRWCHTGTYCAFTESEAKSFVTPRAPTVNLDWEDAFGRDTVDSTLPNSCTGYSESNNRDPSNFNRTKLEFCGRGFFPGTNRPQTHSFEGFVNFPPL